MSTADEVRQVEKIARVFVIEERLRNLNYHEIPDIIKSEPIKKPDICDNNFQSNSPILTVRGFN